MENFKVGDTVKIKKCNFHNNCEYLGRIFKIKEIKPIPRFRYPYVLEGCEETFCAGELELITRELKKSDLKERYICKHRDGRESMFDGRYFLEIKKGKFTRNTLISLSQFTDDLRATDSISHPEVIKYDIMEIYKPEYNVVAKREEKEVKEITMAEVEEKFGCKVKIIKEEN